MGNRRINHRKRPSRGPKFIKARLFLAVLSILASLVFVYRSCLAGIIKEGAGLGLWGLLPSVLLFVAGILTFQTLRSTAPLAFILPSVCCLAADVTSLVHGSKAGEWKFWGVLAAVIAVAYLLLLCLNKRKNLEAPYVFLALTVVLTAVLLIFCGKADTEEEKITGDVQTGEAAEEEEKEEEEEAETEVIPTEETLFLATDKYTIQYIKHEVGQDVNGDKCLFLYYDFRNNSSEALSIPSVSYTKLIQNETECGKASVTEANEEMNNYKTAVEPGMTVTACEVYSISDLSDVEFWAIEFVAAGGKEAAQILNLG